MTNMRGGHMMGQGRMMHSGMMSMHQGRMQGMHGQGKRHGMMGPGMMHMMMVKKLPMMQDELNLDSEQVKKLIDIKADFMKKKVDLRQNIMEQRDQVHNRVMDEASPEDYRSQLMRFYESRLDMQVAAYEAYQQMKQVLTEQQQQKLKEKFQQCPYMKKGQMKRPFQKGVDQGMDEMH
jgi:Spy/CpxP family protein refolding chaperone